MVPKAAFSGDPHRLLEADDSFEQNGFVQKAVLRGMPLGCILDQSLQKQVFPDHPLIHFKPLTVPTEDRRSLTHRTDRQHTDRQHADPEHPDPHTRQNEERSSCKTCKTSKGTSNYRSACGPDFSMQTQSIQTKRIQTDSETNRIESPKSLKQARELQTIGSECGPDRHTSGPIPSQITREGPRPPKTD